MVSKEIMDRLMEIAGELKAIAEEAHIDVGIDTCHFDTAFVKTDDRAVRVMSGDSMYRMVYYYVDENGRADLMLDAKFPVKGEEYDE